VCGITGILAGDDLVSEPALHAMTGALAARGPDGEGFHIGPGIGLGHRRLAIIDVEGGKQPLYSEDEQIILVANGEIFNFKDLRAELAREGHAFRTRTDSEVLIHGYEQWGIDGLLERIEGQYAFAIWDARARALHLARDRMGEKPLFWAPLPDGGLAFASELKALKHAPGVDCTVDPKALARYLVYEYVPAPMTMLRGARKLEPGTRLHARAGARPEVTRYWDLPLLVGNGDASHRRHDATAAAAELLAELRRSVAERLVSDVPLGVFLSGGIDSSAVALLAAEARGGDLDTFSIGFDDRSFDETPLARRVALQIGSRHHEERLSPQVALELLPSIGKLLDEPIGDSSIIPTHLLARFARKHVTVAVGGDGGDELFAGYPTFQAERVARLVFDRIPGEVVRAGASAAALLARALPVSLGYMSWDFKLKQFLRGAGYTGARRHQAWLASLLPADALGALHPDVAALAGEDLLDVVDRRMDGCRAADPWDRLLYFYARGYLGDQVLTKVDRATMAASLESRAPFLDRRVMTLACRIDPDLRLRGFETKHLLKRALRGLLPDAILDRRKQGFAMPIGRWLRTELRGLLEEELGERRLREQGLFRPAAIRKLVDEHLAGKADQRKPLWTLIAFQRWQRAFVEA
jgi:asparagine synthase (glutamine-hydrolysing)